MLSGTKLAHSCADSCVRPAARTKNAGVSFIKYFIKAEADHIIHPTIDFFHAALLKRYQIKAALVGCDQGQNEYQNSQLAKMQRGWPQLFGRWPREH